AVRCSLFAIRPRPASLGAETPAEAPMNNEQRATDNGSRTTEKETLMSVSEIGLLHARYVRLSDRFKSIWTYHQFASGLFKNLLGMPLPYAIDFQKIYDP